MNYLLRTFTLIASILIFSLIIEVALANVHTDNKQKTPQITTEVPGPFESEDGAPFVLDPTPFFVQKPFLCQRGDAFIEILEERKEYRAFIAQGQLMNEDKTKIKVWIFTAVNFDTGTFTIFEWHNKGDIACILAIGKGFEILEADGTYKETIYIRNLLTL